MKKEILLFFGVIQGVHFFKQDCHLSGTGRDFTMPESMTDAFSLF